MKFLIAACTDVGRKKKVNQDSILVKKMKMGHHNMVLAVVCDGMGGFSKGEVASASIVHMFDRWAEQTLPELIKIHALEEELQKNWTDLILNMNEKMVRYGELHGTSMGSTVVAMLLVDDKYFVLNVGDSRAYEIQKDIRQITMDHTVVAREVQMGLLTQEQSERDARKKLLLQCVGASKVVEPDMFIGKFKKNTVFLLCSDGFCHKVSSEELLHEFAPGNMNDAVSMENAAEKVIQWNKERMEMDNISVALIRSY